MLASSIPSLIKLPCREGSEKALPKHRGRTFSYLHRWEKAQLLKLSLWPRLQTEIAIKAGDCLTVAQWSVPCGIQPGLGSQRHNAVSSLELHPGLSGEEKVPQHRFKFRRTAGLLLSGGGDVGHNFCLYPLEMTDKVGCWVQAASEDGLSVPSSFPAFKLEWLQQVRGFLTAAWPMSSRSSVSHCRPLRMSEDQSIFYFWQPLSPGRRKCVRSMPRGNSYER